MTDPFSLGYGNPEQAPFCSAPFNNRGDSYLNLGRAGRSEIKKKKEKEGGAGRYSKRYRFNHGTYCFEEELTVTEVQLKRKA
ncbi:hypothetical protein MRB53_004205 [Persea americana]|uniref:Uncharacterized protein n=1 Tax=Persea americana TaxID=3435 RepID=A0ACC2N3F1_PERAE|nr:hypothetical protein MRB53_004205 [Persea americana]